MGGQSIKPRRFLSDKNARGKRSGGREKSSDGREGRDGHKSGYFSDPFAENQSKILTRRFMARIVETYRRVQGNFMTTYVGENLARLW
jgi:hypothetical protein